MYWTNRAGLKIKISTMTDLHIVNSLKLLEKTLPKFRTSLKAQIKEQEETYDQFCGYDLEDAFGASAYLDNANDLQELLESDNKVITHFVPSYTDLKEEAIARGLSWR